MRFLLFLIALLGFIPRSNSQDAFKFDDLPFLGAAVPAAGGAWTPTSLGSELKIWFKNESLTGADGTAVGRWADSSGNGYDATNSVAAQQPYVTNTGTFGSCKSLFFTTAGTSDHLFLSNALSVARNIASCSIVVALELTDQAATRTPFFIGKNTFGSSRFYITIPAAETVIIYGRRLDSDSATPSDASLTVSLAAKVLHADADYANSAAYAYTNNVNIISDSTWLTDGNTQDTDSGNVTLCSTGNAEYFAGWIAEVIVTVPMLSAENRTNVYNYLKTKFAW